MNVTVNDLMSTPVALYEHHTVGTARAHLQKQNAHTLPVLDTRGNALGTVSSAQLTPNLPEDKPVSQLMSPTIVTVPQYADVSAAARILRNHCVDHAMVTRGNQVVGMISSFDLLKLFDNQLFRVSSPPTTAS